MSLGMVLKNVGGGSMEKQASSKACKYPWQLWEQQPPTKGHYTDQVSGNIYQPHTYQVHQWGREGGRVTGNQEHKCTYHIMSGHFKQIVTEVEIFTQPCF